MNSITLQGGQIHICENSSDCYRVIEGHVLIYLLPFQDQIPGRRHFLAELPPSEVFPSFAYDQPILGAWRIGFVALDQAVVEVIPNQVTDELILSFAKQIGLRISDPEEFAEQLIEKYELNIVKEEGYIYATAMEQKETYRKSLQIIYRLFHHEKRMAGFEPTGNALYDAISYLCIRHHIPILPLDTIQAACGRRFSINDVARVSHFPIREVVLDEKWWKKAAGAMILFTKKDHHPIACFPSGRGSYHAYDPSTGQVAPMNEHRMAELDRKGWLLYRPFPQKKLTIIDLIKFGIMDVHIGDLVVLFGMALAGALIGLLIPYMNEQLYDHYIPMAYRSGLVQILCVMLACNLGQLCFNIVKNLAVFRSMNLMEYGVQSATYDRLINLPEHLLRQYDAAELTNRSMGISTIYNVLADVAIRSIISAAFSFVYLWRMFRYSEKMSWISLLMLTGLVVLMAVLIVKQTRLERKKIKVDLEAQSKIFQFINGIAKIRIAGVEDRTLYEYLKPYTQSRRINIQKERLSVIVTAVSTSSTVIFSMVFYYLMIHQSIELSMGAFIAFTTAFGSFSQAVLDVVIGMLQVNDLKPIYDNSKVILESLPEIQEGSVMPGEITGSIELNNVTFAYQEESGNVIENLSLRIKPGEYVGSVGTSGSGKSTLLKLLLGFETPQRGKIYFDNKDLDTLDKRELRKKFGVVLQDGGLISGSIAENITITAPNTKLERINQAIRDVGLEEDIKEMPMGIHTVLSENSGTISGGQKQRILIARALINRPKVIFFDEATSALDNVTQAQVCESLEKIRATKVVIAHRLSTILRCDRIIVMEKGKIIEEGTYEQLMNNKGEFYQLAIRQL